MFFGLNLTQVHVWGIRIENLIKVVWIANLVEDLCKSLCYDLWKMNVKAMTVLLEIARLVDDIVGQVNKPDLFGDWLAVDEVAPDLHHFGHSNILNRVKLHLAQINHELRSRDDRMLGCVKVTQSLNYFEHLVVVLLLVLVLKLFQHRSKVAPLFRIQLHLLVFVRRLHNLVRILKAMHVCKSGISHI